MAVLIGKLIKEKTLSNGCLFYIQKGLPIRPGDV